MSGIRRRRSVSSHACPGVDETNMQVQVSARQGEGEEETGVGLPEGMHPKGTVLKITCNPGYELNIPKKKV